MGEVSDYAIERELSRGGMGVVYAARDPRGQAVALKLVQLYDPADAERFRREAELLQSLAHPGIVGVRDWGITRGQGFLVMDLVQGASLERVLRERGRAAPEAAVGWIQQAAEALSFAHAQGIVHRDLKPANLVLDDAGRVVVIDFGLAVALEAGAQRLTRTGEILGTPGYMAPEQAGHARKADARADVYGLGACLHGLLCGGPPFGGASAVEVLDAVLTQRAPGLRACGVAAPAWLEALCARCLEKDPALRFPDAGALAQALELGVRGARVTRAPRWAAAAAALGVAAALGGVGYLAWGRSGVASDPPPVLPPNPSPPGASSLAERTLDLALGPDLGADASVYAWGLYNNDNSGANGSLVIGERTGRGPGERWALLRVPLARVPAGAELLSAELILTARRLLDPVTKRPLSELRLRAHRVLEPWEEGTGTIDQFVDGVAWEGRADSPLPARFERPELDPEPCADGVADGAKRRFDLTALARTWLEGSASNFGVCLRLDPAPAAPGDHFIALHSREAGEAEARPRLVLRYRGRAPLPALEASTPPAPDLEDVESITAYLRVRPADRTARLARVRCLTAQGEFGQANYDLSTALSQVAEGTPDAEVSRAGLEFCLQILKRLERPSHLGDYPPAITGLEVSWKCAVPGATPAPYPEPAERKAVIAWRVLQHADMRYVVGVWRVAQGLWPDAPELVEEAQEGVLETLENPSFYQVRPPSYARQVLDDLERACELSPALAARARRLRAALR